ncbi:M28 family metallopeptidase [Nonomuraea sp. K274]|uniref:M28 family metallopeptidase n=1 Tax=Nonomuraea cypriaca TaxID=1187855 RepID=A0A931EVN1_9ACTN|nr:M28 family metallopeptidase [Nonomuraea cypriaca]MBF8184340.1 M28 family metallopeptidase [Nonomuraea cypriaca]
MNHQPSQDQRLTRRQALAGAAAVGGAPLIIGAAAPASASTGHHGHEPSTELRRMLREISAGNIKRTVMKLVSFGTRNTLSAQDDSSRGIGAARDWLFEEFKKAAAPSGGRMTVELQTFVQPAQPPRYPQPTPVTNVVATLHGAQAESKGRTYVVSGHYDSMPTLVTDFAGDAPGANDDASGVAAVLEMARVMATRTFDATIVFMAVAGEEQGLWGSTYFAEQAKQQNRDIAGMFTNDIIGSSVGQNGIRDPYTVRIFAEGLASVPATAEADWRRYGGGETESSSRQLARFVKEVAENEATRMKVKIIYRRDRFGRGGDHIPFLEQGYSAARFTEINEDWRHQHQDVRVENGVQIGDLPEFCDFDYIARVARVNAISLASLAIAPAAPTGAVMDTSGFDTDTTLTWIANTEPDLAGYEVVMRATTDPEWTKTIEVGDVTTVTLKNIFKDNHFFGVRAVDEAGNRSPVSFPGRA